MSYFRRLCLECCWQHRRKCWSAGETPTQGGLSWNKNDWETLICMINFTFEYTNALSIVLGCKKHFFKIKLDPCTGLPRWIWCGGEEKEKPRSNHDQGSWDVVEENEPTPVVAKLEMWKLAKWQKRINSNLEKEKWKLAVWQKKNESES